MARTRLEVADIFRAHGPTCRRDHAGHLNLLQLKVMSAIGNCRTAAPLADMLPVEYFHVVFTLPSQIAAIACQNKAAVCDLLFKASSQTLLTIAADPKHLAVKIGMTLVLHTSGPAMTHHPHVHVVVPGGGLSPDGQRWTACRPGFLLPVKVLSRLFRRLFVEGLARLLKAGKLRFFGKLSAWQIPSPLPPISHRYAKPIGSFMPGHPSVGRRPCWHI